MREVIRTIGKKQSISYSTIKTGIPLKIHIIYKNQESKC